MTALQALMTIGLCVFGTMLTGFLPFILFPENRETHQIYPGAWQSTALCGHWAFDRLLFERCKFPWRQSWNTRVDCSGVYRHCTHMEEKCTFEYCRGTLLYMVLVQYIFIG